MEEEYKENIKNMKKENEEKEKVNKWKSEIAEKAKSHIKPAETNE